MSATQRAVAAAVALLAVLAVGAVLLSGDGGLIGQADSTPSPSAATEPSATSTSSPSGSGEPSATPSATDDVPSDEEAIAMLQEIEEQVIAIRGLEAADIGPPDLISREELAVELEELFEKDYPPEERERDNEILIALGLLEPGQDVAELQLQLLGDQVLGFYDDVEKRMVVVTEEGLDPEAKLTYAHEYTHALQDAAFGIDSLETEAVGEDDRALARTALIEGDATVTMLAWAFQHLTPEELMQIGSGGDLPDTSDIPLWMVNQLQFPYTTGQLWVGSMAGSDPFAPDFEEIDAAWAEPPDTTEQVMEPDAWEPRERAVPVEVPDLAASLGEGWEELDATPVGQANIEIFLQHHGVAGDTAAAAADGWGGDRVVVASGPDDAFAVAWILAWDSAADGAEFADAYAQVVDLLPFPASVSELSGGQILVAHASSEELLGQVEGIAGS